MKRTYLIILLVGFSLQVAFGQTPPAPVIEYNLASWKDFRSAEGGFSVSMPGSPTADSETVDTAVGRIALHLYVLRTRFGEYGVSYADLPFQTDDPGFIRKILDGSRDELLASGAKKLNESDISLEGVVGRELILDDEKLIGRNQMFLVKGRLYSLILATPLNVAFKNGKPSSNPSDRSDLYEKTCSRFFGSFRFTKEDAVTPLSKKTEVTKDDLLEAVKTKSDLYPTSADARKEIEEALKQAKKEKKRVLLMFGANWCYDCHVLDRALHEGEAGDIVKQSFVLVHVDIGEADKNLDLVRTCKIPLEKGVPAVAVFAGDGELLYSSGEGEFEAARKMMKKDLAAFLRRWKPPTP